VFDATASDASVGSKPSKEKVALVFAGGEGLVTSLIPYENQRDSNSRTVDKTEKGSELRLEEKGYGTTSAGNTYNILRMGYARRTSAACP
jgi:hypothetical protein